MDSAAALAQSIQPKGNTLNTTSVSYNNFHNFQINLLFSSDPFIQGVCDRFIANYYFRKVEKNAITLHASFVQKNLFRYL